MRKQHLYQHIADRVIELPKPLKIGPPAGEPLFPSLFGMIRVSRSRQPGRQTE
jgi:hypothetical protein